MLTNHEYRQAMIEGRVSLPPRPKPDRGCPHCHGTGNIADPDGGAPEPCYCGMGAEMADLFNDARLHYLRTVRR